MPLHSIVYRIQMLQVLDQIAQYSAAIDKDQIAMAKTK